MKPELKRIEELIKLAKKYRLSEFSLEEGKIKVGFKFKTAGDRHALETIKSSAAKETVYSVAEKAQATPADMDDSRVHKVLSPFVGTFYRAPSPEAEPYAKEGQMLRKGDTLCIVEAMKLMNEIECEVSGKVIKCLIENGQTVEYGEALFLIEL